MKKTIELKTFDHWRLLIAKYPDFDKLIDREFVDDVHYLEIKVKYRQPVIVCKLQIEGVNCTRWERKGQLYYIYGVAQEELVKKMASQEAKTPKTDTKPVIIVKKTRRKTPKISEGIAEPTLDDKTGK
jgi:hypothetical protein